MKRTFDVFFSFFGLILLSPIILTTFLVACFETKSIGIFRQNRIGLNGDMFRVVKIKTMRVVPGLDSTVTTSNDLRITRFGRLMRQAKLDELPQLWNVLCGQMSFVGPRPDVPGYADRLKGADRIVLSVRPGITGPASLKYHNEESLLARSSDPLKFNDETIWPDKVRINREYVENYSFIKDLIYIKRTLVG
jgi:lipopolysaccharide/colanic/teichoic acid biosynthesis glycosyltransferase